MSRVVPYAITLFGLACMAFIVVGISQPVPHPETYLAVTDKPYVVAEVAVEDVEEWEEEQAYYEPVYYNSYWYESDDADAEAAAKEWIAQRESGGDYNATNGRYIGRYQLDQSYLDGDYSEENQEAAAEAYIADRYGSWQAAQEHHREYGWY